MAESREEKIEFLKSKLKSYPDFPKPGILFWDVFSLLQDPALFKTLVEVINDLAKETNADAVVGLDARGFLFGPIIALNLNIPFVPVRKKGKLPGITQRISYSLEYGEDILEMQSGALKPGQKVLMVDDLLATGGTLNAACKMVEESQCTVSKCLVVIELMDLKGREKLKDFDVISLFKL